MDNWEWPQYLAIAIQLLNVITRGIVKDIREAQRGKKYDYNIPAQIIASGIVIWVLYMGGFFE